MVHFFFFSAKKLILDIVRRDVKSLLSMHSSVKLIRHVPRWMLSPDTNLLTSSLFSRHTHSSIILFDVDKNSSVIDGLEASSTWRRGELSKLSDKFKESDDDTLSTSTINNLNGVDRSQPLEINNDEDVQQMWKEMENRVTRRRSLTLSEARMSGKGTGRKNLRKTDEEAWLEAGLYNSDELQK